MKFLCLHGMGTNSAIFEAQISPLCSTLEEQGHEFEFVDGNVECDAAPGIESLFPGPYFCYYDLPTPEKVQAAFDYVLEVVEEEGPFDAVIGFSQGAAIAASMLLEHSKTNPVDELFKFAVFIAASLPFNLDDETGKDHWASALRVAVAGTPNALKSKFAGDFSKGDEGDVYGSDQEVNDTRGFPLRPELLEAPTLLGRYYPEKEQRIRIPVPTLHIFGDQDPYLQQCESLVKLCYGRTLVVRHSDGHRIPRDKTFEMKASAALTTLVRMEQTRT